MSKYIIEIPDDTRRIWIDVFGEGYCYTQAEDVDDLEELNSDYINENFGELQDEAYQKGFEDGKNSFNKGCEGCRYTSKKSHEEPCFSCTRNHTDQYTPMPKEDDRIEVGDEVTHKSDSAVWKAVCIRIDGDRQHMNLMGYTGSVGYYPVDDFKKTGKHYDIQSILEAMRE